MEVVVFSSHVFQVAVWCDCWLAGLTSSTTARGRASNTGITTTPQ